LAPRREWGEKKFCLADQQGFACREIGTRLRGEKLLTRWEIRDCLVKENWAAPWEKKSRPVYRDGFFVLLVLYE
jgi:hypothetical protein